MLWVQVSYLPFSRPTQLLIISATRPTWGCISREGIAQWGWSLDTCGLFSRSVEDLDAVLDVFQVLDDDPIPQQAFKIENAKIGFARTHNWSTAGPGTQKAIEKAKELLKCHGAVVEEVDLPDDFSNMLEWHNTVLNGEGRSSFLGQYRTDPKALHESIQGYVENIKNVSRKDQLEAYDNCARLRPVWDDIASKYDMVITPSVVDEAPKGLENTGDMASLLVAVGSSPC